MKSRLVLFSVLFFLSNFAIAQVKYEKEERIPVDDFPPVVQALLPQLQSNAKRIRYYREFDGYNDSYEVKFKKHGTYFSIEFSQDGNLEDIEMSIKKPDLPAAVIASLNNTFPKCKLKRIQKQFVHPKDADPANTLRIVLSKNQHTLNHKLIDEANYEIEAQCFIENRFQKVELLFSANGTLLSMRTIIAEADDHIIY